MTTPIRLASLSSTEHRTPADYERARLSIKQDTKAIGKGLRRIAKRQAGRGDNWDGKPDNDNIAWPLAKALLAEGNQDLLKYAMAYRKIEASANSGATLGGGSGNLSGGLSLDRNVHIKDNGDVAFKHVRQSTAAKHDIPGRRSVPVDPEGDSPDRNSVRVVKVWRGDVPVNEMIDNKRTLAKLHAKMGPLVEMFDLACVHGLTLEQVGRHMGVGSAKQASGAARALIHMALIVVRDALGEIKREDLAA